MLDESSHPSQTVALAGPLSFFGITSSHLQEDDNKTLPAKYFLEQATSMSLLLQPKYEKIKKVFIKYNTKLISSASVERLFSIAKHVLTNSRTRLLDENFEKLIILNVSRKNS
jgi:hypothetical protein